MTIRNTLTASNKAVIKPITFFSVSKAIDLLAILQKSQDRALFLYNFIREIRSSGVRASITIVHIRKFHRM